MKTSEIFMQKANYVIDHPKEFSGYMLETNYGIRRATVSDVRHGRRNILNISLANVLKMVQAYENIKN